MRRSYRRSWSGVLPGLMVSALLVGLAGCDPLHPAAQPPVAPGALAAATAAASATAQAVAAIELTATPAPLPQPSVDPGWVASLQIPDGSKFGGPSVLGTPSSGLSASGTMTVGSFKLAPAAQVVMIYGCSSPANIPATLEINFGGATSVIPCTSTGASVTGASMNRSQWGFAPSDVGRTFPVTVTITTGGPTPRWYALIEQPK